MKISLAWVFDHIKDIKLTQINADDLLSSFNEISSELDGFEKIEFDKDILAIGRITNISHNEIECFIPEWKKECTITSQEQFKLNDLIVIAKEQRTYKQATWHHFGIHKDGYFPIVSCPEALIAGDWKHYISSIDYLVDIDNKALSHRPDMWGHRGIAREVAAILGATLVPEERILSQNIIKNYEGSSTPSKDNPLVVTIKDPQQCTRIACCSIVSIHNQPSLPWVAQRLGLMDCKTISALVDLTNYVMFDIGQPMHAFDASIFESHTMVIEHGKDGEPLALLDGTTIKLTNADCVITNGHQPVSLAGIMGGHHGEVSATTHAIVLESGNFNPIMIRKSSALHKKRTEASVRFEKNPDPNQNTTALLRYVHLLDMWNIPYKGCSEITSIGLPVKEESVTVSHEKIVKKIGIPVPTDTVAKRLQALQFGVVEKQQAHHNDYIISVPTFRRDVHIPEDVIEEVARFYGYNTLPQQVPQRPMIATDNTRTLKLHALKNHCAFGLNMTEVVNYNLFDEDFLRTINWKPENALQLINPVSETWKLLVTTLVPHLFKAARVNQYEHQEVRCFEWGKVWHNVDDTVVEQNRLAMIIYNPDKTVDFYNSKAVVSTLFDALKLPVIWSKPTEQLEPWFHPHQTAVLSVNGTIIGYAGNVDPAFLKLVTEKGDAFVVELDGDFILKYKAAIIPPEQPSKYQRVHLDISALVPSNIPVARIEETIAMVDARIINVYLMDSFEKPEWKNQRSLTYHYVINDREKTFTKEEIDDIVSQVNAAVQKLGGVIR
jgi:phenylalanyl-tRNA synthetase beta chain